jgi:hypothetical protein
MAAAMMILLGVTVVQVEEDGKMDQPAEPVETLYKQHLPDLLHTETMAEQALQVVRALVVVVELELLVEMVVLVVVQVVMVKPFQFPVHR